MKNTFVKVLSLMIALMMVVGMFSTVAVFAADCTHENGGDVVGVKGPKCTEPGFTTYECHDCGEEYIDDIVAATGKHQWETQPGTPADCENPAYGAYELCTVCEAINTPTGEKPVVAPNKGGHIWSEKEIVDATCTEWGYTLAICARCGAEGAKSDLVEPAHKLVYKIETPPTLCASGTMRVTCSACDKVSYTIVEEEDHRWGPMTNTGSACGNEYKSGQVCLDCGAIHPESEPNTDRNHNYVYVGFEGDKVNAGDLNQTLINMGYELNSPVKGAIATCEASSWYLGKCSLCGNYDEVEVKVNNGKGHAWGEWSGLNVEDNDGNHAIDKTHTRKCDNCDATETEIVKAATQHVYEEEGAKDVHPNTCENNGYTEYVCDLCGAEKTDDVTLATGHNYGAVVWYSGTCDSGTAVYVKKCPNEGCENPIFGDEADEEVTAPEGSNECKWVKETRVGTCVDPAYFEWECSVCGDTKDYDGNDVCTDGTKEDNHVYYVEDGEVYNVIKLLEEDISVLSCTTDQVDRYLCNCGVAVDVVVCEKLGHSEVDSANVRTHLDLNGDGDYKDAGEFDVREVIADCKTASKTAGQVCERCTYVVKDQVTGAKNPYNHQDTTPEYVTGGDVTCVSKAYTKQYYECCGKLDVIETGEIDEDAHADLVTVPEQPATCTTPGKAQHKKCPLCGDLFDMDGAAIDAPAALPTPEENQDHNWVDPKDGDVYAETCSEPGRDAHKVCVNCDAILYKGEVIVDDPDTENDEVEDALEIKPHGKDNMAWDKGVAPTCYKDGYTIKGTYGELLYACSVCDKVVVPKGTVVAHASEIEYHNWKVDDDGELVLDEYDNRILLNCKEDAFEVIYCTNANCGYVVMSNYTAAGRDTHEFAKDEDGNEIYTTPGTPTCTTGAMDTYNCLHCAHTEEREGAAAIGHKIIVNEVVIDVDFSCKSADHETYATFGCENEGCDLVLGTDKEHNNIPAKEKAPTCTETGHNAFTYCKDCLEVTAGEVVEVPATNHENKVEVSKTPATLDTPEYTTFTCYDCNTTWTEKTGEVIDPNANDINIVLNATNANGATDEFTDSSLIALTVVLSASNLDVWGGKIALSYTENLTFVGYDKDENGKFIGNETGLNVNQSVVATETVESVDGEGETVVTNVPNSLIITAFADFTAEGKVADVTIDGEKALVTLYFRVTGYDANTNITVVAGDEKTNFIDSASTELKEGLATKNITIRTLMDYNGNGEVTPADLLAANLILTGELTKEVDKQTVDVTYDVTLDVDKNGKIEAADLLHIWNYIKGSESYADIAALRA